MERITKSKVIIRSTVPKGVYHAVRECLDRCDWEDVIPENATVAIKPNLCTNETSKFTESNTSSELAAAVCEVLRERTKNISMVESDGLRFEANEAFAVSGYTEWAKKLDVRLVNLSKEPWVPVFCDPAGDIELPEMLMKADVFISLPVLKTHALTYFTGVLKNQWGCVPQYDRILLHKHLDPLLATLHKILNPKLSLMDGIVAMEGRGPTNGKPRQLDLVLASRDGVALDTTAMRLIGLTPELSRHIVLAADQNLGSMNENNIEIDGDWDRYQTQFEPAILDIANAGMNYMSRYRWFVKYAIEKDFVFYPVRRLVQILRKVGVIAGG